MTKRHTDSVSNRFFYLVLRRSLFSLALAIPALTVSGCIGCGSNDNDESSLAARLARLRGIGSGNQSQTNENGLCPVNNDINRSSIPRTAQIFDITLDGEADLEGFSRRSGFLIVRPTVQPAGDAGLDNGPNVRDVGFFSDDDPLVTPQTGAITFVTNTAILKQFARGDVPDRLAAVDVAFVDADATTDTLTIKIDGKFPDSDAAANTRLNVMSASSKDSNEDIFELVGGTMTLEFAGNGEPSRATSFLPDSDSIRNSSRNTRRASAGRGVPGRNELYRTHRPSAWLVRPRLKQDVRSIH